nr:MAG TPA: gamma delta Resolvase, site specific recombination [Caudoviricetes sp.]
MRIAYVRVSTVEQNEARQVEALREYDIERWYIEKVSGRTSHRPKLQEMLDFAREGDIIYIHDFSRLARNTKDLLEITEKMQKKGVKLISKKEALDTSTPAGKMILTFLAAIYEFEVSNSRERQLEGIAIAKRAGKYTGGKKKKINKDDFDTYYARYQRREITKTKMAAALKISRPTLDRILKERGAAR